MDLSKKILAILAIFCVIASATAVCAADDFGVVESSYADDMSGYAGSQYDDGGYAGSNYQDDSASQNQDDTSYADDMSGYAGSNYQDDGGWAGSQYNETLENASAMAAGEPINATNATNTTAMAVGEPANATNATNATAPSTHTMLSTGNPILLLFGVGAALGGYAVLKRKN